MARLIDVTPTRLVRRLHTPFVTALRRTCEVVSVAVRVTDAEGAVGYGEAPQVWRVTGESLAGIEACVAGPLAEALVGLDPAAGPPEQVHRLLAGAVVANGGARAACEVAVLDLLARRAGLALPRFLNASATSVATDVTISADGGAWSPVRLAAAGFDRVKVKVGLAAGDVERVVAIFRADPAHPVRLDANQGWDLAAASAAVEALLAAGVAIEFLEQPLPAWDLAGHAELRRRFGVPVVLDESVFTVHDLRRAIDAAALDTVNIKLAKCGGILAGVEIAEAAHAAGVGVMVGSMMESELGTAAAATLAAVVAPDGVHDLDAAWWSIEPADPGSPYAGGRFHLSDAPGLSSARARVAGNGDRPHSAPTRPSAAE